MKTSKFLCAILALTVVIGSGSVSALASENLLQDPFLSHGLRYWHSDTQEPSKVEVTTEVFETGGAALRLTKEKGTIVASIVQDVEVKPNTQYVFAAYVKGETEGGAAVLGGYAFNEAGEWLGHFPGVAVPPYDEFGLVATYFRTSPNTVRLQVRLELFGDHTSGVLWVDRFYLGERDTVPDDF